MTDPIQTEFRKWMNDIARSFDKMLQKKFKKNIGFVIFLFEFNETSEGRVNYISNARREDMIVAMKEWLARHEGRYHEPGTKQ